MSIGGTVARRNGNDTIPASPARVVLHGVSRQQSGKIDSTVTDGAGAFRFRVSLDTSMVYLLSANWSGIEYFSEPVPGASITGAVTLTLLVADTSSDRVARTGGRFIVLGSPGPTRDRRAVDLFVIRNAGDRTIVGRGGTGATWRAPLPRGVTGARLGSAGSEISADAVRFEGDSVAVIAPITPGERQLLIEYTIPASLRRLEVEAVTPDTIQVVAEEQDVTVSGLEKTSDQVLDGRPYARWQGRGASRVTISFPVAATRDRALVPLLIAAAVIAVLVGIVALRSRPARTAPIEVSSETLLTRIAALDAEHAGRILSDREKSRYERDRAELKRALTEQLRREGRRGL